MDAEAKVNLKVLNRDTVKYIAAFTMLLNHISLVFLGKESFVGAALENIGYFTAVTMCYFLVEGFYCTSSRKKYACRLFAFGLISQIPYFLTVKGGIPGWQESLNMMFTLLLCFSVLLALEYIADETARFLAVAGLFVLSLLCDWALLAPGYTLLFWWSFGLERERRIAFALASALLGLFHLQGGIWYALGSMAGAALSGVIILHFYNGKRSTRGRKFSKWFFYWFYPVHLLLLWIAIL